MDIRQLHYFLVLCEEMNYTRAAQRLFLSRQALRQSISALEAELCGPLFLSAHHKLTLTDRGMSLQRHATPVVEQFQQMQAALRAEIQSAQPVHIGISVALVPDYLPGLETQLDKFRQQYPHVEMRFRLLDNDAVADAVEQGELDAGLVCRHLLLFAVECDGDGLFSHELSFAIGVRVTNVQAWTIYQR